MKKLNHLTFVFTILVLTISFNTPSYSTSLSLKKPADLLKKKDGGGEKFDFKNAIQILLKHFESSITIFRLKNFY